MKLEEIYAANENNVELQAYISLYHVLIEGQDECWETWDSFAKDMPSRERLLLQKRFEVFARSDIYTRLTRVVLRGDKIIKQAKSFAIDYCRRNEAFEYDLVD